MATKDEQGTFLCLQSAEPSRKDSTIMELEDCPVKTALNVIGGKWKPLILFALKTRVLRFEQLRVCVPGATQKVLTEQLKQLQRDSIVARRVVPGSRSHTEYCLTDYGKTLRPALNALANWGMAHREKAVQKARLEG